MAAPTYRGVGAFGRNGGGGANPTLPSGTAEGDLLIMFGCTYWGNTFSCSGWSQHPSSPVENVSSTNNFRLTVLYKIAGSGEGTPAPSASAGDWSAFVNGVQVGTFDSGDPFDAAATGSNNVSGTSTTFPGITTTVIECLVFYATTTTRDEDNSTYGSWTQSGGATVTERFDLTTSRANGGGLAGATWVTTTAGSYGTGSATHANGGRNYITLSVQPSQDLPGIVMFNA